MLLKVMMIAGNKRRRTTTEQGCLHWLWNEAKHETEDVGQREVAQVAQVTAPTGARCMWQHSRANDALKEYQNQRSELRDMQCLYTRRNILLSGSASMMPRQLRAYHSEREEGPLDVANMHVYVVAVHRTRDEFFVAHPLQLRPSVDVATQFAAIDEEAHQFQETWSASVAEGRSCLYPTVALSRWFLYDEGAWRLPKPSNVFGRPRSNDDTAYARIGGHAGMAGGLDSAQEEQHKAEKR